MKNGEHSGKEADDQELEVVLSILEKNFDKCLDNLNRYITYSLILAVVYLVLVFSPQDISLWSFDLELKPDFALGMVGTLYIAAGGMTTFIAERAHKIARVIAEEKPLRFSAMKLHPGIGMSDLPIVRFVVSFLPTLIIGGHLCYLGYLSEFGKVAIPLIFVVAVGITLWSLLPIGKYISKSSET